MITYRNSEINCNSKKLICSPRLAFMLDLHSCVPCLKLSLICWNMVWQPRSNTGSTMLWKVSLYAAWMGPCIASAAARPMASVVFCEQKTAPDERGRKIGKGGGGSSSNGGTRTDTCLGFDHLADVVLQRNLHGSHLGSDRTIQLICHRLQTLGNGWTGRKGIDKGRLAGATTL